MSPSRTCTRCDGVVGGGVGGVGSVGSVGGGGGGSVKGPDGLG